MCSRNAKCRSRNRGGVVTNLRRIVCLRRPRSVSCCHNTANRSGAVGHRSQQEGSAYVTWRIEMSQKTTAISSGYKIRIIVLREAVAIEYLQVVWFVSLLRVSKIRLLRCRPFMTHKARKERTVTYYMATVIQDTRDLLSQDSKPSPQRHKGLETNSSCLPSDPCSLSRRGAVR